MKLPILVFLLAVIAVSTISDGRPPGRHYHCDCADICANVPAEARCQVQLCNGDDVR